MQRRVCWQAKSSWSGEISMTQAKRLKESRCFTTIQRSLPAHWTKPCWHIGKQATPRKRIAYRASCGSDIRITPVDNSSLCDWRIMAALVEEIILRRLQLQCPQGHRRLLSDAILCA